MRLVTRGDLDGLTCAVLICLQEKIENIALIHPQDITDNLVEIGSDDVIANLPYHPNCAMWFDHHLHTATAAMVPDEFKGKFGQAPSAARLVYEYYDGEQTMPQFAELVHQTDRLDSADLQPEDVLEPQGYIQLGFTIDGRSGLGSFHQYFQRLVGILMKSPPVEEVLADAEVKSRCMQLYMLDGSFRDALKKFSRVEGNVVITDFRKMEQLPVGNRFLVYALFPDVNVSVRLQWGPNQRYPIMTLGHSIFKRTCKTNVGELCARYGGGGHRGAGSVPLMEDPEQQIQTVIAELRANG